MEERLQALAEEVSQQHADIIERLHVMEIAAERSRRLPPTLYSALLGVAADRRRHGLHAALAP